MGTPITLSVLLTGVNPKYHFCVMRQRGQVFQTYVHATEQDALFFWAHAYDRAETDTEFEVAYAVVQDIMQHNKTLHGVTGIIERDERGHVVFVNPRRFPPMWSPCTRSEQYQ